MVLDVDIREILAMAWDNPIFTGGLVLMFTPPMFRVLVFFYPLLICTALCAVALVSFGQQIETSREREIAGWNAKIVDGDRLSSRLGNASGRDSKSQEVDSWSKLVQDLEAKRFATINEAERLQSQGEDSWSKLVQDLEAKRFASINEAERFKSQGEESWSKLVQDLEAKQSAPHNETERYNWTSGDNNHNEEALKKHSFRVDSGRMENPDGQDVRDNQNDEFRDYERSATGRRSKSQGEESWWKSVQDFEATPSASHNENERHNWRSSDNSSNEGLKKHPYRVDGSHTVYLDDQELLDHQIDAFREYERSATVRRSKSQGEESWWKSVQDSEAKQSASNNENGRHSWSGYKNNNKEGLKKHPFRLDDQELLDRQIEAFREYERSATGRRSKSQGEESWWKSVQDSEARRSTSNHDTETYNWMNGGNINKEEGLNKHRFRVDGGRMEFPDGQDVGDRQIEDFGEYERSATGQRSESQGEDSWWKSVQDFDATRSGSNHDENGRHSWTGSYNNHSEEGLKKHPFRVDGGKMVFLDDQDILDRQIEAFREYERKFSMKTRAPATTAGDIGTAAASRGGGSPGISSNSSPSTRTTSVSEERYSNSDVPTAKIPPTFLYTLRTGGTGSAVKASSGKKAQAPSSFAPGPPAPAKNSQEGRIGPEGLSNSYGNVDSSASMKQRGTQPPFPWQKPGNVFETGKIAMTRTAEMEPNVFAKVKNSNHNAPTKNYTWPGVIKPNHQFEGESAGGFTKPFEGKEKDYSRKTSTSTQKGPAIISSNGASPARRSEESRRDPKGKESLKRFFSVRGPVIDSGRAASPSKQVEERSLRRAPTYNAALRSGNAVLYNAGSDSNAMSLRRKGHGSVHRK